MNHRCSLAGRCRAVGLVLVLTVVTGLGQVTPTPPERMTYQGFLVDADGVALGYGQPRNYDVEFRILNADEGGEVLWGERQTVAVDKGYFSVLLGEGADIGEPRPTLSRIFTGPDVSDRYVGITVKGIGSGGTDVNITPRLRLLTSPYAFLSRNAASVVSPDGAEVASASNGELRVKGQVTADSFSGDASGLSGLSRSQIPPLDASQITSGQLSVDRIGNLDMGQITSGSLSDARLSGNVARRDEPNTFSAQQRFTGLIRMGPASSMTPTDMNLGLMTRAVRTISVGDQIATIRGFVLERDGSHGGFRLRRTAPSSGVVAVLRGVSRTGAQISSYRYISTTEGEVGTTWPLVTNAQNPGMVELELSLPLNEPAMVLVRLTRCTDANAPSWWIGTKTATSSQ